MASKKKTQPNPEEEPQGKAPAEVFLGDGPTIPEPEEEPVVKETQEKKVEQPVPKGRGVSRRKPVRKPKKAEPPKPLPTLHVKEWDIRLGSLKPGDIFKIGDLLYRLDGTDGIGLQVTMVTPVPGGFRDDANYTFGHLTICQRVLVL